MLRLYSRCGQIVILNVFKTGINAVSFLPVYLSCVLGGFYSPVVTPAHGLLGLWPSLRLRFISESTSLLCILVPPPTVQLHYTKLLTRALFWDLPLFICFRSMSGLSRSCCM